MRFQFYFPIEIIELWIIAIDSYYSYTRIVSKLLLRLFLSALFLLTACQQDPDPDILVVALTGDIRNFDSAQAVDVRSGQVIALTYDNLVHFGDSTELIPGIAKSWTLSNDRLTYSFSLYHDFRFHDGTEITAGDIRYSLERAAQGPQSWLFTRIVGANNFLAEETSHITGIFLPEGEDGFVVTIKLTEPFSPFIQFMAMPASAIVNRKAMESGSIDLTIKAAGSGPWKLVDWVRDGHLLFSANEDYFHGSPKMKKLKLRIISEEMTQSAEFETGNLDVMEIPLAETEVWLNDPRWEGLIYEQQELSTYYIGLNCSRQPFDDARVRQAMNLAVDREKILLFVLSGNGTLSHSAIPPGISGYDHSRTPYSYDPQQAQQLLNEAGFPDGFSMELWQSQSSGLTQVMEAFQSYWKAVGIEVKIVRNDWNMFKSAIREGKPDAYYLDWFADYPDGENFLFPLFHSSESMTKRNRYSNLEVDRRIEEIQSMPDSPDRNRLLIEVDRLIYDDAPWVFLWHSVSQVVTQQWISGFEPKLMFNAQRYINVSKKLSE